MLIVRFLQVQAWLAKELKQMLYTLIVINLYWKVPIAYCSSNCLPNPVLYRTSYM